MVSLWRLVALVPLLAFGLFQVTSSSQDDQCRFTFTEDEVLDVTQSQDQGAKVSKDLHVSNKIQCAEECCSIEGEWCTLAVYHTQAMGDAINCFLVQCVPDGQTESVCVSTHMRHSGFILATVEHQSNTTDLPAGETLPPSPTQTSKAASPSSSSQPNPPPPAGASPSPSPTPTAPASPNHTTPSSIVPAAASTTSLKAAITTIPSHTGTNDSTTTTTTTTPVPNTMVPSTNSTTSLTLSVSPSSNNSTTSSASTPSTQSNSTLNSSSPTTATPKPFTPPSSSPFPPSGVTHGASPHPSNMSTSGHDFEEEGDNATMPLPQLTPSSSSPPSSSANPQDIVNDHDSKTTSVATTALKTTPTSKTTPTLKAVSTTHGETDVTLPSEEEITTPTSESISPSTPDLMKPNGTAENQQGVTNTIDVHHDNVDRETVTKTGILIVALCFGIIFFLAMMVVIGKRWCEGYQRRKYSKVDYLINGIYS